MEAPTFTPPSENGGNDSADEDDIEDQFDAPDDGVQRFSPDSVDAFVAAYWTALSEVAIHDGGGDDDEESPREQLNLPPTYPLTLYPEGEDHDSLWEQAKEEVGADAEYSEKSEFLDEKRLEDHRADHERAREVAEEVHSFLRSRHHQNTVVFVVPQWFGKKEFGEWCSVFYGTYNGLTKSGKAYKVENILPFSERNEDEYFKKGDRVDFQTLPRSMVEVFKVEEPESTDAFIIEPDGASRRGRPSTADVTVEYLDMKSGQYLKAVLDWPAPFGDTETMSTEIREVVKSFEKSDIHWSFDEKGNKNWRIDADSTPRVLKAIVDAGYSVAIEPRAEARLFESGEVTLGLFQNHFPDYTPRSDISIPDKGESSEPESEADDDEAVDIDPEDLSESMEQQVEVVIEMVFEGGADVSLKAACALAGAKYSDGDVTITEDIARAVAEARGYDVDSI